MTMLWEWSQDGTQYLMPAEHLLLNTCALCRRCASSRYLHLFALPDRICDSTHRKTVAFGSGSFGNVLRPEIMAIR